MILILGKNDLDATTEEVISWLEYKRMKWLRINGDSLLKSTIHIKKDYSLINDIPELNTIWYRRLLNDDLYESLFESSSISNVNSVRLYTYMCQEALTALSDILQNVHAGKWLTHPSELRISKLNVLRSAHRLNISIPETIITTSKKELIVFKALHNRLITKCITDSPVLVNENDFFLLTTQEINDLFIERIANNFPPSLFQELIEKEYEIRTFYLDNKFYSMAIFSQKDNQTKVDFRNYNRENPNRTVPYQLPEYYENDLRKLMIELKISTASIDIIKSLEGKYIFLECNPVGQIGMTSHPCNYSLEKIIATYLSENE